MTEDRQGLLDGLGFTYLSLSGLGVIVFAIAAFVVPEPGRWWFVGAAIAALLQGLVVYAVLAWMATVASDTASMRRAMEKELPELKKAVRELSSALFLLSPTRAGTTATTSAPTAATPVQATKEVRSEGDRRNAGLKAGTLVDKNGIRRCGRCRAELSGVVVPAECPQCGTTLLS